VETIKARVIKFSDEKKYRDSFQIEKEQEKLLESLVKKTGEKRERINLIVSAILSESLVEQSLINNEKITKKIKVFFDKYVDLHLVDKIEEKLHLEGFIVNSQISEKGNKLIKRLIF